MDQASPRVAGQRAVIEFTPKLNSVERLCAGIVVRLSNGEIQLRCSVDTHKAEHAFGASGAALAAVAFNLCESLAHHWQNTGSPEGWKPPFEGAKMARVTEFTARNADSALELAMGQQSSLHALLAAYEIPTKDGRSVSDW